MAIHTHECDSCHEHYLCSAPMDGDVCATRVETDPRYRRCTLCNAGQLPCEHCDGQRRGTFDPDLRQVICEDCYSNQGEAQSERRLRA